MHGTNNIPLEYCLDENHGTRNRVFVAWQSFGGSEILIVAHTPFA